MIRVCAAVLSSSEIESSVAGLLGMPLSRKPLNYRSSSGNHAVTFSSAL